MTANFFSSIGSISEEYSLLNQGIYDFPFLHTQQFSSSTGGRCESQFTISLAGASCRPIPPDEQGMEDERAKMEIAFNPRKGSVRAWLALMELLWIWMEGGLFAERRRNE